tara:strand:+ start:1113 stop:1574 length:462 start_codon:yes stop_codon:yes gene_type:complete
MKKLLFIITLLFSFNTLAQEETIANCQGALGYAYYHSHGLVPHNEAGWGEDKITKGIFTLKKLDDDKLDLLFIDATQSITSSIQSGGTIFPIIRTGNSISIIIIHKSIIETYSFWENSENEYKFSLSQTKTGDIMVRKNSLLVGSCNYINFNY